MNGHQFVFQPHPTKPKLFFSNLIDLFAGEAYFRSRKARELNIETPIFNAMHEGTEFLVKVSGDQAQVIVFDGVVLASNKQGQVRVKQGQSAQASKGQAPVIGPRIELRDAVQWTLYYPPVIDYSEAGQLFANSALQPILGHILNNDLTQAFEQLNVLPVTEQTADYYVLYASLLLTVGQVDEALKHLNQIKQNSPRQAEALSLRSMIALAQNDQPKALQLAQHAEQINNTSPSPHIALSYVYQAQFDIDKALKSAQQAAQAGPKNGLAWARVSELELATGNVDDSMQAADQAQRLNPRLSKTNTVLGFARLASLELSEAEQSFREAIARDPSDPLARLGLGLAKIRQGHIKSGTRDMETAANLDPGNALIRSYLGKAYYEQRRGTIASTEYKIAKYLDPKDPTPWFYDAIYKQTVNRPVEALHDMQKAIELNDNRAVFRSKLLLDEDLAARSAALGRIYNELGFQQLGLVNGWKALDADFSNYSAHRLLADNYSVLPRHELARASELLQSQLLQPINVTPVQPSLATTNLLILDGLGPSELSFMEFNPLFARNRLAIQAAGTIANNDTFNNETVISGLKDNYSFSLGQYHSETDGFRPNNKLNQNIYNALLQVQMMPNMSVQTEVRFNEIESGDRVSRFADRGRFDEMSNFQITKIRNPIWWARGGLHYTPSKNEDIVLSIVHRADNFSNSTFNFLEGESVFLEKRQNFNKSFQMESQYMLKTQYSDFIFGMGYYRQNQERKVREFSFVEEFEVEPLETQDSRNTQNLSFFTYSNTRLIPTLTMTIGLGIDTIEKKTKGWNNRFSPKFGLRWNVTKSTTLRTAWFKTVKKAFSASQTIETTQVSGFNQLFDDINQASSKRYGVAIDHIVHDSLNIGVTASWRNVSVPNIQDTNKQDEKLHYAYIYWTPFDSLSFSSEYRYVKINNKRPPTSVPSRTVTHSVPLKINYYNSTGLYSKFTAIYNNQSIFNGNHEKNDFITLNALVGYRLTKRFGKIEVGVNNLLDKDFNYEGFNLDNRQLLQPFFQQDRVVFGRIQFSY